MHDLHLAGRRIECAHLDEFDVVVELGDGVESRINGTLAITVRSGLYEILPDESVTGPNVERLPEIEGTTLSSATVDDDGTLILDGDEGRSLRVPADPEFEGWRASPRVGSLVVSGPGGELFIWDDL